MEVPLDQYGYTCSICNHIDAFDEEMLLRNSPVEIIRIKVQEHIKQGKIAIHNFHGEKHKSTVALTLPCTRRTRHLPVPCRDSSQESCFTSHHWRICPGFYRVTILVSFRVADRKEQGESVGLDFVCVNRILNCVPPSGRNSVYSLEGTKSDLYDDFDKTEPGALNTPTARCRAVMDLLFSYNCSYVKMDFFCYNTTKEEKQKIHKENIILQRQLSFKTEDGVLKKGLLSGVVLSCKTITGSDQTGNGNATIMIPVAHICNILYARRQVHTPTLYFHSYDICRGAFGIKTLSVTLVLISKSAPEIIEFCDRNLEAMNIRSNPFLQISPSLRVCRLCQVLDPSLNLQIKLVMCCNLLFRETTV